MALLSLEESGNSNISVDKSGSEYLQGMRNRSPVLGEGSAVLGEGVIMMMWERVLLGMFGMMMMMMMMVMMLIAFGVVGRVLECIGGGFC